MGEPTPKTRVVLYGCRGRVDQFRGVSEFVRSHDAVCSYERLWSDEIAFGGHTHPHVVRDASVVACADLTHNSIARVARLARDQGTPLVLLVDGVVEWSHTMLNPWLGTRHLRPAPATTLLAMGELQAALLAPMGNRVRVTGLPRLDGFAEQVRRQREQVEQTRTRPRVAIATANCPAMAPAARHRVRACLKHIAAACDRLGVDASWRVTGGMEADLGVTNDRRPLAEWLADCDALVTTASTITIEGMLADVPVGIIHPHPWPLWIPSAWEWHPAFDIDAAEQSLIEAKLAESVHACDAGAAFINRIRLGNDSRHTEQDEEHRRSCTRWVQSLLEPSKERLHTQRELLSVMHTPNAAERVTSALLEAAADPMPIVPEPESHGPTIVRSRPRASGQRLVVSVVVTDRWPVQAIAAWSRHTGRAFAEAPELGYRFETLHVVAEPASYADRMTPFDAHDRLQHVVTLEPTDGRVKRIERVVRALESLRPDVVLHNHGDLAIAACGHLRALGSRVVEIVHQDAPMVTRRLHANRCPDGLIAVGMPGATPNWVDRVGVRTPAAQLSYGVSLTRRRSTRPPGPLRLISIASIMYKPMRSFDLLDLIAELRSRSVPCEFDLVGDGPDREAWLSRARAEGWTDAFVRAHGRLPPQAIESLLLGADAVVSVAEREGAGLAVLEGVGGGAVACVTNTGGGASRWLRDGLDGVVVPVGRMDRMAEKLVELVEDPQRLLERSHAGQARLQDCGLDAGTMVKDFARAMDTVLAQPPSSKTCDDAVSVLDDEHPRANEDPGRCDRFVRDALAAAGYKNVTEGTPLPGCDAVVVRAADRRPSPEQVEAWRSRKLGVAISPSLRIELADVAFDRAFVRLHNAGCKRVALWPTAGALHRVARAIDIGAAIIGVIEQDAQDGDTCLGLRAIKPDHAMKIIAPDAVLLLAEADDQDASDRLRTAREWGVAIEIAYANATRAEDLN